MSPAIPRSPEITVLTVAARLAGLALVATAVTGLLMLQGVLRASPTRFAALAVAALTFINWLVRLLMEIDRLRSRGRGGPDGGTPSDAPEEGGPAGAPQRLRLPSVYEWFRRDPQRERTHRGMA